MNVCCIITTGHPDPLFKHDPIDASKMVRKDGKPFFETESFKMTKAGGVECPIPVLIGTQVVLALVKD